MVLFLISDIAEDPRKVPSSKADHTITSLPIKQVTIGDSVVDVMGTGSLHLPDPIADQQCWRDAHNQVDVIFNTANLVEVQTWRLKRAVF